MKTFTDLLNEAARKSHVLRELTSDEQRQLKLALLEEYKVIAKFCEENNLTLFLGGGSCLGAVRHKGYIPWDDDIDLNMPRADYDKLINLIEQGLFPKGFEFSYPSKYRDCKNPFLKIFVSGTKNIEIHDIGTDFPKGISIDIFPMENVPESKILRKIKAYCYEIILFTAVSNFFYENQNPKFQSFVDIDKDLKRMYRIRCLVGWLFHHMGHRRLAYWADRLAQCKTEGELVTYPSGRRHYMGEIAP